MARFKSGRTVLRIGGVLGAALALVLASVAPAQANDPAPSAASAAAPDCGGQQPPAAANGTGAGKAWQCSFDDEFDGTSLNAANWSVMTTATYGFANSPGCYVDSPNAVSVANGVLSLTTSKAAAPFTCHDSLHGDYTADYTSGSVTSQGKFAQRYGVFSIRAKFSAAKVPGIQSSLWMWPATLTYGPWPQSGEIDIAEEYSLYPDRAIPTMHYSSSSLYSVTSIVTSLLAGLGMTGTNITTNDYCLINNVNAFHTYTLIWEPGVLEVDYDGVNCLTDHYQPLGGLVSPAPFDQPFFMLLTQGFGTGSDAFDPDVTPLPQATDIDYVRVWQST